MGCVFALRASITRLGLLSAHETSRLLMVLHSCSFNVVGVCVNYCAEQAEAQVEWRLLVVEALGGDVDAAEERGLGGHKLREALETEDRDGDGFVTIDEV